MDGQNVVVPDLSVIRVFAGDNLQTDATFKTVLLNSSTTSHDLVRQALQRFRLPAGEEAADYYLTVKQIEGSSARLRDEEKPLVVFEELVEAAMELPKVKRSSMGSISSIASNLSMHPAIKKLPMNDFTDDSAVKFYLNRHGTESDPFADGDETMIAADVSGDFEASPAKSQFLSVTTAGNVPPERFSSPSFRFGLQLMIYAGDLPEDMAFDPLTEAIIFKETLKDRSHSGSISSISHDHRRKVFVFPKNVTVAEVIEIGLERFGISEGVVDGGDEVEDKSVKRRSLARVRYGLAVSTGGQERELSPSSKVIDAYPRPPVYRNADRRSVDAKRRSIDSAQLLGTMDDVAEDDPVFVLRRAISYRNSTSRHRMSAPLDEIALRNLHRESASSQGSEPPASALVGIETPKPGPTHREIIEAQRQAKRENQRAILSSQTNSVRGLDVLLPGNAMLRSARPDANDDRMRYSYVDVDGETYDISDIVEEEGHDGDLLEDLNRDGGATLHRVLSKIKKGKAPSVRSSSPSSQYSMEDRSRSVTPGSAGLQSRMPVGRTSPAYNHSGSRPGTTTPTAKPSTGLGNSRRQPSIQSVMSDLSGYVTAPTPTPHSRSGSSTDYHRKTTTSPTSYSQSNSRGPYSASPTQIPNTRKRPFLPKDDFGVAHMISVIECRASKGVNTRKAEPLDTVDEMLFGRRLDTVVGSLHPKVREVYEEAFKEVEEAERYLDTMLVSMREREVQGSRAGSRTAQQFV